MRKKVLIGLAILYSALMIVQSVNRSEKVSEKSDYYVYWQTGRDFYQGEDIYDQEGEMRAFIYPPFAAFFFQFLAFMPLRISALFFFLLNALVLLPMNLYLIVRILEKYGLERKKLFRPMILTSIAFFTFFWNNLNMLQVNFLVFSISLAGIFYLSEEKYGLSLVFLGLATFIKIYPLFLLMYVFFLHLKRKHFLIAVLLVFSGVFIPSLQRGLNTGINDHTKYYESFLKEFQQGKIVTSLKNHTVKSFLVKAVTKEKKGRDINTEEHRGLIMTGNLILLLMLASLIWIIFRQITLENRKFSILILSAIFIFTHMVSGISWTAHFVTSLFWYLPVFLIRPGKFKSRSARIFHIMLMVIALFLAIEGSDTTGKTLYEILRAFDIFVLFPLILFFYYLFLYIRGEKNFIKT